MIVKDEKCNMFYSFRNSVFYALCNNKKIRFSLKLLAFIVATNKSYGIQSNVLDKSIKAAPTNCN